MENRLTVLKNKAMTGRLKPGEKDELNALHAEYMKSLKDKKPEFPVNDIKNGIKTSRYSHFNRLDIR
jgi:hypothetical protein